jgi:hypothetical protein
MKKFQKVKICDVTGGRSLTQKMALSAPNMILKSEFQISCCNAREIGQSEILRRKIFQFSNLKKKLKSKWIFENELLHNFLSSTKKVRTKKSQFPIVSEIEHHCFFSTSYFCHLLYIF